MLYLSDLLLNLYKSNQSRLMLNLMNIKFSNWLATPVFNSNHRVYQWNDNQNNQSATRTWPLEVLIKLRVETLDKLDTRQAITHIWETVKMHFCWPTAVRQTCSSVWSPSLYFTGKIKWPECLILWYAAGIVFSQWPRNKSAADCCPN